MRVFANDYHSTTRVHRANPHAALSRNTERGFSCCDMRRNRSWMSTLRIQNLLGTDFDVSKGRIFLLNPLLAVGDVAVEFLG